MTKTLPRYCQLKQHDETSGFVPDSVLGTLKCCPLPSRPIPPLFAYFNHPLLPFPPWHECYDLHERPVSLVFAFRFINSSLFLMSPERLCLYGWAFEKGSGMLLLAGGYILTISSGTYPGSDVRIVCGTIWIMGKMAGHISLVMPCLQYPRLAMTSPLRVFDGM